MKQLSLHSLFLFVPTLLAASSIGATQQTGQQIQNPLVAKYGIEPDVAELFSKIDSELLRTRSVQLMGRTHAETQPSEEMVDEEVKLFRARQDAGKLDKPSRSDALLCFNLLLHKPEVGREYFALIVEGTSPGEDALVDTVLVYGARASGSWGEQFALQGLQNEDIAWRKFWANYLWREATEKQTAERLRELVVDEQDVRVKASMYFALGLLLDQEAVPAIKTAFPREEHANVKRAMIYAVAEIEGRDAMPWLESLDESDPSVTEQIEDSYEYLRDDTTEENPHGFEIESDREFLQLFGDLKNPAIDWLNENDNLNGDAVVDGKLIASKKTELFDVLDESLGFGLEAVKGTLFRSLEPADLPRLKKLRALCAYCPGELANDRRATLLIMIRSLKVRQ